MFDVWSFTKSFTTKNCYYIDYGQENFHSYYFDAKRQAIKDSAGVKFEKGEWIQLVQYLESQGYEQTNQRIEKVGDLSGTVTTFRRKKQ